MPVVIVNPTAPLGDHDVKPTPTGKIVLDFLNGDMPAFIDTGLNVVDVRDTAEGHWQACERGRSGERYILGSENLTLAQILQKLAAITGKKAPTIRLPYAVAYCAGACSTAWAGRHRQAAARAAGSGADGQEENVGEPRKGEARTRLLAGARRAGAAARGRVVPRARCAMKLLMVAADAMEFPGILAHASEVRPRGDRGGLGAVRELGRAPVLLAANGAGARRAAAAVDAALEHFDAEAVVSTGFCGALDPELADCRCRGGERDLGGQRRSSPRRYPSSARPHHTGVVCSIDHVAQTAEEKRRSARARAAPPWRWKRAEWRRERRPEEVDFTVFES